MKLNIILILLACVILMQFGIVYQSHQRVIVAPSPANSGRQSGAFPAPPGSWVDIKGMPKIGNDNAKVVLIEFSDYECPYCARHATSVLPELKKTLISGGAVQYVFANNPLSIHSSATLLATAAICAGRQNHYWEMHEVLFNEKPRTKEAIVELAKRIGVHESLFTVCLGSTDPGTIISADIKQATKLGLKATPSFALGLLDEKGNVEIQTLVVGAIPLDRFESAVKTIRGL